MPTNLTNYLESILNPRGCFRTLDGIFARCGENGEPLFSSAEYTVKFETEWQNRRYRLICFLQESQSLLNRVRALVSNPVIQQCPYLAPTRYLDREMLVFDDMGHAAYHDVVLQEADEGIRLDKVLLECSMKNDAETPGKLLRALYDLSCWMYRHGIVHNNIRLVNVQVLRGETLRLINFESAQAVSDDRKEHTTDPYAIDNLALANLAIVLYLASCNPRLYGQLRHTILHRLHDLRKILPELCRRAESMGHEALFELTCTIRNNNGKLKGRERLNSLLKRLIDHGPVQDEQLREILLSPLDKGKAPQRDLAFRPIAPKQEGVGEGFPAYDWKSGVYDTLVRVEHRGKYFYTDRNGKRAIDREYDFAYDFYEGRAVVVVGDNYALIDREGTPVIPFICEDLEWDPFTGTAKVMIDGKWGLFDRSGQPLVPMKYDWMGGSGDGLIVARIGEQYGYIRKDGSEGIPFIYEDAFSFEKGKALVELNGEQFSIDTEGHRI